MELGGEGTSGKTTRGFLRWVLAVERRTLGYIVREELKRDELRSRAAKRA